MIIHPIKTISFGGLGDSFIVSRKLYQEFTFDEIDHLFVESNQKTLDLIKEFTEQKCFFGEKHKFQFECDPDYQTNFNTGKWKDRFSLNTTWHGLYRFPRPDGITLRENYANIKTSRILDFDVCLQVAAGAQSSRHWRFDVFMLKEILESKGYKVCLVGSDPQFASHEYCLPQEIKNNFVCKTDLHTSALIIRSSKVYCGLSGFQTYFSLACGIPNVHLEESAEHNSHYIHPSWEKNRYGIRVGSLNEVIQGLRHWGIKC